MSDTAAAAAATDSPSTPPLASSSAPAAPLQSKSELEADLATVSSQLKALKLVNRPDEAKYKKELDRVKKGIDKLQEQLTEVKEKIEKQVGKGKGGENGAAPAAPVQNSPKQNLIEKIKKLQAQMTAQIDEAKALRASVDSIDNQKKAVLENIKKTKADIPFQKVEDIEREISRLEESIAHGSDTSVSSEKQIINKINTLKQSKKLVSEQANLHAQANALEEKRKTSQTKSKELNDHITTLKEQITKLRDELKKLDEAAKATKSDVPSLFNRRTEIRDELNKLFDERKKLNDEQNKEFDEWKAFKKDHDKLTKREKDLQYLIRKIERIERGEAAAAAAAGEGEGEEGAPASPWAQEITVCNDLIAFIQRQLAQHVKNTEDAAKKDEPKKKSEIDGKDKIMGKQAGGEESLISLGKPKPQKQPKKVDPAAALNERVPLSLDTILYFSTIEVATPSKIGDLENTLKDVQAKKAYFESNPAKPEKKAEEAGEKAHHKHHKAHVNHHNAPAHVDGPKAVDSTATPAGAWASKKN